MALDDAPLDRIGVAPVVDQVPGAVRDLPRVLRRGALPQPVDERDLELSIWSAGSPGVIRGSGSPVASSTCPSPRAAGFASRSGPSRPHRLGRAACGLTWVRATESAAGCHSRTQDEVCPHIECPRTPTGASRRTRSANRSPLRADTAWRTGASRATAAAPARAEASIRRGSGGHLLPAHRRRHGRPLTRAQRVHAHRRLVRVVLAPVDEHPPLAQPLGHARDDQPGQPLLERLGDRRAHGLVCA